jgi:hypothetical protein
MLGPGVEAAMVTKLVPFLIAAALAGCAEGGYYTTGTVMVSSTTPDLVYVAPGVSVIADYDVPIFYADGFYWTYSSGYWYRSPRYTGGWVYVSSAPYPIARIRQPYAYVHYRPYGYVARHRPVPSNRIAYPTVRDHRAARRPPPYYRY